MLISINGPIAGKLSIVQICDTYGKLIRRINYTTPTPEIDVLYGLNIGWSAQEVRDRKNPLLSEEQRKEYFHNRILGNVLSLVEVLSIYIEERLKNLNDIQQGRVDTEINTEKSPRFFYNLPGGVVAHITNMINNHPEGVDFYTYDRLRMRIEMETANIIQTTGMIAPNQRCDDVVRSLIQYRSKLTDAVLSESNDIVTHLAEYLLMWTYIARMYFGAVNIDDQDVTSFSQLPVEAQTLQVGDDVIAAVAAPTFESLKAFSLPTNGYASTDGVRYVSALNDYYLVRD